MEKCTGCGKKEASETFFQCPLCHEEEGRCGQIPVRKKAVYCSQPCFAKSWRDHRRGSHPSAHKGAKRVCSELSGTVDRLLSGKEERKRKKVELWQDGERAVECFFEKTSCNAKVSHEGSNTNERGTTNMSVEPWGILPSVKECEEIQKAVITPPLCLQTTQKAVIACCIRSTGLIAENGIAGVSADGMRFREEEEESDEEEGASETCLWWSAATAAAHFLFENRSCIRTCAGDLEKRPNESCVGEVVIVVAGDALTAHAFAWACRCSGLSGCLCLHAEENCSCVRSEVSEALSLSSSRSLVPVRGFIILITTEKCFKDAESQFTCSSSRCLHSPPFAKSAEDSSGKGLLNYFFSFYSPPSGNERRNDRPFYRLVTLPDVAAPEALERADLPALFFVGESKDSAAAQEIVVEQGGDRRTAISSSSVLTHRVYCLPMQQYRWMKNSFQMGVGVAHVEASATFRRRFLPSSAACSSERSRSCDENEESDEKVGGNAEGDCLNKSIAWELDDRVSTCLVNGDVNGAIDGLMARYERYCMASSAKETLPSESAESPRGEQRGGRRTVTCPHRHLVGGHEERFYRLLVHTWRCDWGALNVVHAHHRFMDFCRALLHQDDRFVHQVLSSENSSSLVSRVAGCSPSGGTTVSHHSHSGGGTSGRCLTDIVLKALYATAATLPRLSVSSSGSFIETYLSCPTNGAGTPPYNSAHQRSRRSSSTNAAPDSYAAWESAVRALLPETMSAIAGGTTTGSSRPDALEVVDASVVERNKRTISSNYLRAEYPSLQLQAFLSHIYPYLVGKSSGGEGTSKRGPIEPNEKMLRSVSGLRLLDALSELWGVDAVVPGCKAVFHALCERKKAEISQVASRRSSSTACKSVDSLNSLHILQLAALQRAADRLERGMLVRFSAAEAAYISLVLFLLYEMLSGELTPECKTADGSVCKGKGSGASSLPLCLTLAEVERRLQWSSTAIGVHFGELKAFLRSVELYHPCFSRCYKSEGGDAEVLYSGSASERSDRGVKTASLSSRSLPSNAVAGSKTRREKAHDSLLDCCPAGAIYLLQPVRLPLEAAGAEGVGKKEGQDVRNTLALFAHRRTSGLHGLLPLPWVRLPSATAVSVSRQRLTTLAAEEILSAMPKKRHIPMYIGDVGKLIGKWNHFNAKYEGVLGVRLQDFLEAHPEHWTVVENLVTRRRTGSVEGVKLRYEESPSNLRGESDSDDEGCGRLRQRRENSGTASGVHESEKKKRLSSRKDAERRDAIDAEKSSKARKKILRKAFNQSRTNKNYKRMDPAARVPGYKKRGVGKIKGRGKKANIRSYKRGTGQ